MSDNAQRAFESGWEAAGKVPLGADAPRHNNDSAYRAGWEDRMAIRRLGAREAERIRQTKSEIRERGGEKWKL